MKIGELEDRLLDVVAIVAMLLFLAMVGLVIVLIIIGIKDNSFSSIRPVDYHNKYTALKNKYNVLKDKNNHDLTGVKATNRTIKMYLKQHNYKAVCYILKFENKAINRELRNENHSKKIHTSPR